jgi:hypothetical protein
MTSLQIERFKALEAQRSNQAREAETHRSNVVNESEAFRSNTAREEETARHNRAQESLSKYAADKKFQGDLAKGFSSIVKLI